MLPETMNAEARTMDEREHAKQAKSKLRAASSKKASDTVGSASVSKKKKKFQEA